MKRSTEVFILLIICSITLAVYANHFHNAFHFDDSHTISNNLSIREIKNIPVFFTDASAMSTLPANQSYRPLLVTTLAVDFYLSGKTSPTPFMFHVSSFLFFLLLGVLCYYLFRYLLQQGSEVTENRYIAIFTTAWFFLHAANAETVNYIIARSDLLSVLLMVAGFVIYFYSAFSRRYYLYLLPVLAGLLTKEHTIMFVPILFFYHLLFQQPQESLSGNRSQFIKTIISSVKVMVVPFVITMAMFLFVRSMTAKTWTPGGYDRWHYILTQPAVLFHYFYNFLLPANLVADTDWTVVSSITDDRVFAGLLFIAALVAVFVWALRQQRTRAVAFGIAWFLLSLAPTSLMPFAEVLNDHRTFFAYIGLFIAAATLLRNFLFAPDDARFARLKWPVIAAGVLFLTAHAFATRQRNAIWSTEKLLWKEATVKAPGNGRAWMNYGVALMAEGNFAEAERCFIKTTQLWPTYSYAYTNLGVSKQYTGNPVVAEEYFKKSLAMNAAAPVTYSLYGNMLLKQGRLDEAAILADKGLQLSPSLEPLLQLRSAIRKKKQQPTQPAAAKPASTPEADAAGLLNQSLAYYNTGDFNKCIETAEAALKIKPDYDLAYNNICAAWNRLQKYDKAIAAGEKGLVYNPDNQLLKGNLAEARRLKGR